MRPELRQLEKTIEGFYEAGILHKHGYYSISEAYQEIADHYNALLDITKSFKCCDQVHKYHALQPYIYCPLCHKLKFKNTTIENNESYYLVRRILTWLNVDLSKLPKWNKNCEEPEEIKAARLAYEKCNDQDMIDELVENYIRLRDNDETYKANMKLWWETNRKIWFKNHEEH